METDVTIRDVMTREYVGVSESDTVQGAVELMREEEAGSVVVLRGSDPVGIFTEWDVLGVVADEAAPGETTVASVMSEPVLTVAPDERLRNAAGKMSSENVRRLVVTDADEIQGVLTARDVIAAAASFRRPETANQARSAVENSHDRRANTVANGERAYSDQSVCETCGSLADTLREANGQLVCAECREL
ncbi:MULTISPECIES: cyclic nucleotide-binding/CBS domain-containing protein [Halostella]|uniref:CBS domain-containing protein n=1 Tax=Halostella TaxID=1843185 RepID=UPI001080CE44|nr:MULTISPECIES: CBS domain-containing protein [Halostella]